jgi:hypothetical protein
MNLITEEWHSPGRISIASKLSPGSLLQRVREGVSMIEKDTFWSRQRESWTIWKPRILGLFEGAKFKLHMRGIYYTGYGPVFAGEVRPTPTGSEIVGEFILNTTYRTLSKAILLLCGVGAFMGVFAVIKHQGGGIMKSIVMSVVWLVFFGVFIAGRGAWDYMISEASYKWAEDKITEYLKLVAKEE